MSLSPPGVPGSELLTDFHELRRLGRGTFVGVRYPYVYMETPKAACSTMKAILLDLEQRSERARQLMEESQHTLGVHDRRINEFAGLADVTTEERHRLLNSPGVTRFCVVRNPYARLASAWINKIRMPRQAFVGLREQIHASAGRTPDTTVAPPFADFVHWLAAGAPQSIRQGDVHWRRMSDLVLWNTISYTHVLRAESLVEDLQPVLDALGHDASAGDLIARHTANVSRPYDWKELYDHELAAEVHRLYEPDFANFGYDPESWQWTPEELHAASTTAYWEDRLVSLERWVDAELGIDEVEPSFRRRRLQR